MRFIRHSSVVGEHLSYSVRTASVFPHGCFWFCFSVITHTHEAKVLVDMRDKLLMMMQRVRQVYCSAPSSKHLTDNSAAIHSLRISTALFISSMLVPCLECVEFLPANAISNSEKQRKCTESVYLLVFQMKLY